MRHLADIPRWCDDVTDSASPTRFARRSLFKAAVLGRHDESDITGKTVKLYDVTGRLYISKTITSQKTTINVGNRPSGMYILKVEGGNLSKIFKLIKQSNLSP